MRSATAALSALGEIETMPDAVTAKWLVKIAAFVAAFPTMPQAQRDDIGVAMTIETPAAAVAYSVRTIRNHQERATVQATLPTITTEDFAIAAGQIRDAAERLG
jgi:hypothetical protein